LERYRQRVATGSPFIRFFSEVVTARTSTVDVDVYASFGCDILQNSLAYG
jgi:hypothetical protein